MVLQKLIEEITAVSRFRTVMASARSVQVTAFVAGDFSGPDVVDVPARVSSTPTKAIDGSGPDLASALDDVLGKVALSAPVTAGAAA